MFWTWGWKISSQNIRKFFLEEYKEFFRLGARKFHPDYIIKNVYKKYKKFPRLGARKFHPERQEKILFRKV